MSTNSTKFLIFKRYFISFCRTKTFSNETFELPLPDEIMMKIFEYFSGNQILINIAPVCKQFYRLSQEPKLLKKIVITHHMDRSSNSKMQGYMHGIKSKKGKKIGAQLQLQFKILIDINCNSDNF